MTQQHAAASDGFLVGRVTFEEMCEFWPRQVDDKTGVTDHLNHVEKYVVSRGIEDPGWEGTTILRGATSSKLRPESASSGGVIGV